MQKHENKILIICSKCEEKNKESIVKNLESRGYSVEFENSYQLKDIKKIVEEQKPLLIIYRLEASHPLKVTIKNYFEKQSTEQNRKILYISSFHVTEKYLDALQSGIAQHVNFPCTQNYLMNRIDEILKTDIILTKKNNRNIEMVYNDKTYKLKINDNRLQDFMLSALDNSLHQKKILEKRLKGTRRGLKETGSKDKQIENKERVKELEEAFDEKQFKLYYQPVHSMHDNKLSGFEALIRWEHPERGVVPPDDFIPIVENSNLIFRMGIWIIEEACKQTKEWNEMYQPENKLRISINLSPKQFHDEGLIESIFDIIDKNEIDPETIAFEITESTFMFDMDIANTMLLKLKSKNIKLYMDDFGTGYSSLSYLMHFPVDVLKIDKSFVKWMHIDEQSEQIVKGVIALAHNLQMQVVSEGLESEEHHEMLKDFKSDYGQGYFYDKPLRPADAENYIQNNLK